MKLLKYLGIAFAILLVTSCSNSINGLFNETKKGDDYFAVTIPKWVMKTADKNLFVDHLGTDDNTYNILSDIKKARVLVQNDKEGVNMENIHKIFNKITNERNYNEFMSIMKDGKITSIVVNEKKDRVKDILLFTESENKVVLLHLESNISMKKLVDSNFFDELK